MTAGCDLYDLRCLARGSLSRQGALSHARDAKHVDWDDHRLCEVVVVVAGHQRQDWIHIDLHQVPVNGDLTLVSHVILVSPMQGSVYAPKHICRSTVIRMRWWTNSEVALRRLSAQIIESY